MIGKDVIIGTGDIVLGLILVLGAGVLLWLVWAERRESRREEKLIGAARELEIGEGVTLYEGIRACFGADGYWGAPEDSVYVIATAPDGAGATLRVCPELGQVEVYSFSRKSSTAWTDEPEALIGSLIEAANRKVTFRAT